MVISLEQAQEVILGAFTKAKEIGVPVNIVVLDTAGFLKGFARMDLAVLGSIDIAIQKAKTSMLFGINSEEVGSYLKPEVAAYGLENTNGGLLGFAGGRPIRFQGQIIGYIGISGGAISQDAAIAEAGSNL
jgi:uncharacterized protein GlcG (DUF336 family)